jgi:hypothetical protein
MPSHRIYTTITKQFIDMMDKMFTVETKTDKPASNGCSVFISTISDYNAGCRLMGQSTMHTDSPLLHPHLTVKRPPL